MSARPLDPATKVATNKSVLPLATIIRLDILGDPLLCWTGINDLTFPAGSTGDTALDGLTFSGVGSLVEVGTINDSVGGSDALNITLPGVDITSPILRQLIYNRNRWQFRRAWVWMMLLDPITSVIVGKPFRVKTGRIDQMPYNEDNDGGSVSCSIEGQQAYGSEPLGTRYSEQPILDPNDISQTFVISLSNMTASLGTASHPAGSLSPATTTGALTAQQKLQNFTNSLLSK